MGPLGELESVIMEKRYRASHDGDDLLPTLIVFSTEGWMRFLREIDIRLIDPRLKADDQKFYGCSLEHDVKATKPWIILTAAQVRERKALAEHAQRHR